MNLESTVFYQRFWVFVGQNSSPQWPNWSHLSLLSIFAKGSLPNVYRDILVWMKFGDFHKICWQLSWLLDSKFKPLWATPISSSPVVCRFRSVLFSNTSCFVALLWGGRTFKSLRHYHDTVDGWNSAPVDWFCIWDPIGGLNHHLIQLHGRSDIRF